MIKKLLLLLVIIVIGFMAFLFIERESIIHFPQDIIVKNHSMQLAVSPCPLQKGSLNVEPLFAENNIVTWNERQHADAYNLLENVAALWKKEEFIEDFMVIGMIPPRMNSDRFFLEIIPYTKSKFNFFDQFSVLWHLTFGSSCLSTKKRLFIKNQYIPYTSFLQQTYIPVENESSCTSADPFCRPDIIEKQLVYEGKHIYILYDYAPIGLGKEKLHFLIVPKNHRDGFPDLTKEEYLEAQNLTSKLVKYYENKFPIAYLFHKTGTYGGQTVPHWHQHVIFAEDVTHEFFGKLKVMLKMLFYSKPLSESELEQLVNKYREQVQEAMKQNNEEKLS